MLFVAAVQVSQWLPRGIYEEAFREIYFSSPLQTTSLFCGSQLYVCSRSPSPVDSVVLPIGGVVSSLCLANSELAGQPQSSIDLISPISSVLKGTPSLRVCQSSSLRLLSLRLFSNCSFTTFLTTLRFKSHSTLKLVIFTVAPCRRQPSLLSFADASPCTEVVSSSSTPCHQAPLGPALPDLHRSLS